MNPLLRQGSALLMVVGLTGCTPPDPPVLPAPAAPVGAVAPARESASNDDDIANRPIEDAPEPPKAADLPAADDTAPSVVSVALDHAGDVVIGAGQQHRARRRAGRCGVEIGQAQAFLGQRIEVRRSDFAAERTDVGKA